MEGPGAVALNCSCVRCIFCEDLQHSPSTTVFGIHQLLLQCSDVCANAILLSMEGTPKRQIRTWLSWRHVLGQSGVPLWSWSSESIPGCRVLASQGGKASFQRVFFDCEVWSVWERMIEQHCKAAVVKQAALFKMRKCNKPPGVTQYGKYCSRNPFLCPFCTSLCLK